MILGVSLQSIGAAFSFMLLPNFVIEFQNTIKNFDYQNRRYWKELLFYFGVLNTSLLHIYEDSFILDKPTKIDTYITNILAINQLVGASALLSIRVYEKFFSENNRNLEELNLQ